MSTAFERDYPWLDAEGDCPTCDGTGEVICRRDECQGSGCRYCLDGQVTCPECDGTGYQPGDVGPEED
jgi:hypothetical protein